MADFALWAAACETPLWPAGTFARAYAANRRAAIDDAVDADSVATCVREFMAERASWAGRAVDLLRVGADRSRNDPIVGGSDWPKNPRALAGRLRRAQTFLRALGIEIAFSREGRGGSRIIRMRTTLANTVSAVRDDGLASPWSGQAQPGLANDLCDNCCATSRLVPDRAGPRGAAGDADGADAKAVHHVRSIASVEQAR
jgi:hypothetical protein